MLSSAIRINLAVRVPGFLGATVGLSANISGGFSPDIISRFLAATVPDTAQGIEFQ